MKPLRIAILGSTRGTHLIPIMTAIQTQRLKAEIVIVLSNRSDAGILEKAWQNHLNHQAIIKAQDEDRVAYDQRLVKILKDVAVDLVVLMGFMRILSPEFIAAFKGHIINVHPSLLPKHKGLMDLAVHQAVLDRGEIESGCTVHLVENEVDSGKILIQNCCKVDKNDTAETLKAKVQALEVPALIDAIQLFIDKDKV